MRDLDGVARTFEAASRLRFSSATRAQRAAFCWRLRALRRWFAPLLKVEEVILFRWDIRALGAVSMVSVARDWARVLMDVVGAESAGGDARLVFSANALLEGLAWRSCSFNACSCFCFVSASMTSIALLQISNALRKSPVWLETFLEHNSIAAGWINGM